MGRSNAGALSITRPQKGPLAIARAKAGLLGLG